MKRPEISLSAIESTGPKKLGVYEGTAYVKATPCPVCDGTIEAGEFISKIGTFDTGERWAHMDCAEKAFNAASVRNAWALLGADAARRPRAYSAKDLRTILGHLVQLVYRDEYDDEFGDRDAMVTEIHRGRGADGVYTPKAAEALIRLAAEGGDLP